MTLLELKISCTHQEISQINRLDRRNDFFAINILQFIFYELLTKSIECNAKSIKWKAIVIKTQFRRPYRIPRRLERFPMALN